MQQQLGIFVRFFTYSSIKPIELYCRCQAQLVYYAVAHQEQWPKLKRVMCDVDNTAGHAHERTFDMNYKPTKGRVGEKGYCH